MLQPTLFIIMLNITIPSPIIPTPTMVTAHIPNLHVLLKQSQTLPYPSQLVISLTKSTFNPTPTKSIYLPLMNATILWTIYPRYLSMYENSLETYKSTIVREITIIKIPIRVYQPSIYFLRNSTRRIGARQ